MIILYLEVIFHEVRFIVCHKSVRRKKWRLERVLFDVITTTETNTVAIQRWKLIFRKLKVQITISILTTLRLKIRRVVKRG